MTYSTPGVYVEEIAKFPPSVAQVQTAIPAFIGYTEKAQIKIQGDLNLVPTRITSMLEYETYFGFPANETAITVTIANDGNIIANGPGASKSPFIMYYSMQMYFANGGGPCYITSVGQYKYPPVTTPVTPVATSVVFDNLEDGLVEVRKEDEPTLLVFPDATSLGAEPKFYDLYKAALSQSYDLQDRFAIFDTYTDAKSSIADFRNGVNSDPIYLKYGAAYYPYLKTILNYRYLDSQVLVDNANGPDYSDQITTITGSISATSLQTYITQLQGIQTAMAVVTPAPNLPDLRVQALDKAEKIEDYISSLQLKISDSVAIGNNAIAGAFNPDPADLAALTDAKNDLAAWNTDNLDGVAADVATEVQNFALGTDGPGMIADIGAILALVGVPGSTPLTGEITDLVDATSGSEGEFPLFSEALTPFSDGLASLSSYELNNNVVYNQIKAEIANLYIVLPSSSAMAGVYARIDGTLGVWKAPANTGLNYVIAPSKLVSNEEQGDMNVTSTGKSINAIRSFTGKGTLVWGARTLAGNSNEWRYISVRRFFNMVEESVSEASEQFVFSSNDANTWVQVRAMIENFLILQWKAGALAGAKPEQAFYVRVGLGQTMTAEDILAGSMIIEIGMAVVRPAEFIILRFSHKMQEA